MDETPDDDRLGFALRARWPWPASHGDAGPRRDRARRRNRVPGARARHRGGDDKGGAPGARAGATDGAHLPGRRSDRRGDRRRPHRRAGPEPS